MRVTLSVATSADGFLDDTSPQRLLLSTSEDWAEVYRLRASHDAILVGAETLRRDDPALLIRDEQTRRIREQQGSMPDIAKVTVTASGDLSPALRFFTEGRAERYIFSSRQIPELSALATIILTNEPITARLIVTELEKRGIERLFVEGGAQILRMFLREGMADTVRVATNPTIHLGETGGPRFDFTAPANTPCIRENLGGMEVATYTLHPDTSSEDLEYLHLATEAGLQCTPSATSYCVGAVIVTADGTVFTGHTHETSLTHHAEQEALAKALAAGSSLRDATIYSSMEPCSQRNSEPESCSQLILRHGFRRVVFALYEPDRFVHCRGALMLREAGLDVRCYPALGEEVRAANLHLLA